MEFGDQSRFHFDKFKGWASNAIAAVAVVGMATTGAAQTSGRTALSVAGPLMVPVTTGRGPGERVVRFQAAPDAEKHMIPDAQIMALSTAMTERNRKAVRAAQLAAGIQAFGDTQGAFGAMGTLAEHAAFLKSFSRVNTALNNIGFVMALAQVSRDAVNGNTEAALYGAIKSFVNYSIGRWGSSALQIAGVATFVVDVTLREWQAGLTDIGVNVWTCRYKAYYDAHGRKVSDWKVEALKLYEAARKANGDWFNVYLDGAVNEYVHRAFSSDEIELYSECNGSSFGGTTTIQRLIEAEFKGELELMLAEKVLPEIAARAWRDSLKQQVSNANYELVPQLNQTMLLEVTAYDAPDGTRVVMPLPNGGEWGGELRSDGTFRAKLTYFALMKAGFPDRVQLVTAEGATDQELVIADGRMTTVFGTPNTPIVVRYEISEGAQSCNVRRIEIGKPTTEEDQSRPARPTKSFDMAMSGAGAMFLGHYDLGAAGWSPASPGRYVDAGLLFGAPYVDDIQAMRNCRFDLLSNKTLVQGDCTIERFERKVFGDSKTIERICESSATVELVGIFASLGGADPQYFAMDTPAGKAAVDIMRQSLSNAMQGYDPQAPFRAIEQ